MDPSVAMILQALDDRELFISIQSSKKFRDHVNENFWKERSERRIPLLIQFKGDETWSQFYLSTVRDLSLMLDEYGYDYWLHNNIVSPKDLLQRLKTEREATLKEYVGRDIASYMNRFYKK